MEYSTWATPIVVLDGAGQEIGICGDYKSTPNHAFSNIYTVKYTIPPISEVIKMIDNCQMAIYISILQLQP